MRPSASSPVVACLAVLLTAAPADAILRAVAPGGSIQAAVDAVAAAGGGEVRVAAGNFNQRVAVPDAAIGSLQISGGWDPASDYSRQPEGFETIVDAGGGGRPLIVECTSGLVTISRLTLTGGSLAPPDIAGGGAAAVIGGHCRLVLTRLRVTGNKIEKLVPDGFPVLAPLGCGIYAHAREDAAFELRDSEIVGNACDNQVNGAARGGGLDLATTDYATALVDGNRMTDNTVAANEQVNSGGLAISVFGASSVELTDNLVQGNRLVRAVDRRFAGGAAVLELCAGCHAELRRNQWLDNRGDLDGTSQLIGQAVAGTLVLSDSIVAGGDGNGAAFHATEGGTVLVTNLTIADNAHQGASCDLDSTSRCRLSNSIIFGNAIDAGGFDDESLDPGSNLLGVDPRFVDPATRDYRLRLSSPAIDRGNDSPLGGLGPLDVAGLARVQGRHVDIGAHEAAGGGGSSAGICRATEFGVPNPAPADTHACDCFSEPLVLAHRCSFLLRDGFIWVRIPIPVPPSPFAGEWSILPWSGADGPYALGAQVLVNGKWQSLPVGNNGQLIATGKLADGKMEKGKLVGDAVTAPLDLRLLVRLPVVGGKGQQRTWELELLLPAAPKP